MPAKKKAVKPKKKAGKSPAPSGTQAPFAIPPGWKLDPGGKSISLHVETKDFLQAMEIINDLASVAEEAQHHPDFHLERWNQLRISTWSHDVGGLSDRDENLAKRMTEVLARYGYPK